MGVHESQSLLWERMVGLSRPFSAYLLPRMREFFPQVGELCVCVWGGGGGGGGAPPKPPPPSALEWAGPDRGCGMSIIQ